MPKVVRFGNEEVQVEQRGPETGDDAVVILRSLDDSLGNLNFI